MAIKYTRHEVTCPQLFGDRERVLSSSETGKELCMVTSIRTQDEPVMWFEVRKGFTVLAATSTLHSAVAAYNGVL